jgi:hypothetical protein
MDDETGVVVVHLLHPWYSPSSGPADLPSAWQHFSFPSRRGEKVQGAHPHPSESEQTFALAQGPWAVIPTGTAREAFVVIPSAVEGSPRHDKR